MEVCRYYKYEKKRIKSANCHIFEFNTSELDIDVIGKIKGSYERLTSINSFDGVPIVKVLATLSDKKDIYEYPTAVIWRNGHLSLSRTGLDKDIFGQFSRAMIQCDCTLIIDSKIDISYPVKTKTGELKSDTVSNLNKRKPRTIVGQTDTKTIICVVDGNGLINRGFKLQHAAKLMLDMGCISACIVKDNSHSQFIYMNEIMSNDKYERRDNACLYISSTSKCKNIADHICRGRIIENNSVVEICDVCYDGNYIIKYNNENQLIKGTQIKII